MVHAKGSGLVLAAVIGLMALAPAQADAAGDELAASRATAWQTLSVAPMPAPAPEQRVAAPKLALPSGIGANVRVTYQLFHSPSIAIDPNQGTNLAATSEEADVPTQPSASNSLPLLGSGDGGASWGGGLLQGLTRFEAITHPGVAYLNSSTAPDPWRSFIGVEAAGGRELDVSHPLPDSNGFEQFTTLDTPANGPDMPMIATDPRRDNGGIYVGYTANPQANAGRQPIMVVSTHDSGATFGAPVQVWDSGGDSGAWPAVGTDGTVYMVWDDTCGLTPATAGSGASCPKPNGQLLFSRSTDGAATWSATPTRISDTTTGFGSILPHYVTECRQGCQVRPITPAPQIAVDRSGGPRNGTLYVVYGDGSDNRDAQAPSAHRMHVFLQESKNGGATWSNRVQLDTGNPNDAWEPTVAVDQANGNVVVAWYDRRDHGGNGLYRPYFSESLADSGGVARFTAQLPVADAQSDPKIDCNGTGDRMAIAAAAGQAHVIWTDMRFPAVGASLFTSAIDETAAAGATTAPAAGLNMGNNWLFRPGGARDIGLGSDCTAWIIGLDGQQGGFGTWFLDRSAERWNQINGGGVRIANTAGFGAWLVNNGGSIYRLHQNGLWESLPGAGTDIAAGGGRAWLIGVDGVPGGHGVYSLNDTGSGWQFANGGGVRIAVGPDGQPWIVNDTGAIWHLAPGGWVNVPGGARDIGVGADGSVWILGLNWTFSGYQLYRYNGTGWDALPGSGGVAISVGPDGMPWIVQDGGTILERY